MGKVWYCANCGYEVGSRGRCHSCREKLIASDLPELEPGDEDDEVGYRIGWWSDRDRGRLIEYLNVMQVVHRFEEEELVVAAEDEERVDDLLEELSLSTPASSPEDGTAGPDGEDTDPQEGPAEGEEDSDDGDNGEEPAVAQSVKLLADAARRLTADPTDMHADADVAEASAGVFLEDEFYGTDAQTWAAVGRVTRRLLVALGADEAMEDEIRLQASILGKLLAEVPGATGAPPPGAQLGVGTVYELPEWLPEQRAHLSLLLDEHRIRHEWDGDDLVVSSDREDEAEGLFDLVGAAPSVRMNDDDEFEEDESRYRALEELFSASGRLSSEPENEQRQADLDGWATQIEGPAPVGMDEAHWLRIINKSHSLREAIRAGDDPDAVAVLASDLHGLLRTVV